jgi:hypothetical protein
VKKLFPSLLAFTLLLAACTPAGKSPGSGGGAGPGAPTGTAPGAPGIPDAQGTFSGGGGNGINGRAIETYSVDIESLPEYKRVILPILRKMAAGRPDVLVTYLTWAVKNKAWYFVPVELEKLPKEKIQLSFQSDQLARHLENEVFIYAPAYSDRTINERAALLMHEMVMAAKLLMKKSPQAQCEALTKASAIEECRDPKTLKFASTLSAIGDDDVHSLNGVDHAAVRTMTLFLTDGKQEPTGLNVTAERIRLGFTFPWDSSVSRLTAKDLLLALERARLAGALFNSRPSFALNSESRCLLQIQHNDTYFYLVLSSALVGGAPVAGKPELPSFSASTDFFNVYDSGYTSVGSGGAASAMLDAPVSAEHVNSAAMDFKGVVDPQVSESTVDRVSFANVAYEGSADWQQSKFEFFLSRTKTPELIAYRISPVKLLLKTDAKDRSGVYRDVEWITDKTKIPVLCKPL